MTSGTALAREILETRLGIIEASAGTGKTFTLENLFVELVVSHELPIEKILAVTFTDKATNELKSRVRKKLEESLLATSGAGQAGVRARIERALASFDSASISTLHAFCQRILVENAFFHRRLFEQELVDGDTAFAEAFQETLRRELATDPVSAALLHALKLKGKSMSDVAGVVLECWNKRAKIEPKVPEAEILGKLPAGDWDQEAAAEALLGWESLETALVQRALPLVVENLRRKKAEAGVFDYQDMLELVAESLDGPFGAQLIALLTERYSAVLVDEFQDTDEIQWKILSTVFMDEETPRRLYVIGDPKQAIYGFRGASIETYRAACAGMMEKEKEPARKYRLGSNFRSSPAMISATNRLFSGFFDPPEAHEVEPGRKDLGIFGPAGEPLPPVVLLAPPAGQTKIRAAGLRKALASAIAAEIKALTGSPISAALPARRALRWEDVFVLAGKHSELASLAEVFEQEGIPAVLFKQGGLFQSAEALAIRDLLQALADPEDRSRRARVLLTPFFGLDLGSLLKEPLLADSEPLLEKLSAWRRVAIDGDFAGLFSRILSETGVLSRELFPAPLGQALTNFRQLFEFLLEDLARTPTDLASLALTFDSYVKGLRNPPGEDADKMRLPPGEDAVKLLTFHSAKGLEAPVVFVAGGFTRNKNVPVRLVKAAPRTVWVGTIPDRAPQKQAAEDLERQENRRLMYVAATRAKVRLYLPYFPLVPRGGKKAPALAYDRLDGTYATLNSQLVALEGNGLLDSRLFARQIVDYVEPPPPPAGPDLTRLEGFELEIPTLDAEAEAALQRRVQERRGFDVTSYTGLKAAAGRMELSRGGADHPRLPSLSPEGHAREVREPGGIAFGVALHEILEKVPLSDLRELGAEEWFASPEAESLARQAAEASGIAEPEVVEKLVALATAAVATPLVTPERSLGPLLALSPVLRESGFHFPIPEPHHPPLSELGREGFAIEQGVLKGFIDVLFAHKGRTYLLDWKSDWLPSYEPEALSAHVRNRYELQLHIYSLALSRMLGTATEEDFDARFGGFFFAFPRAMDPARLHGPGLFFARPSWRELARFEEAFRSGRDAAALFEGDR